MTILNPYGMTRRHFMKHVAGAATAIPTMHFLSHLEANANQVKKQQKACILIWMAGGPPSIDIWDLKPGSKNGGEFKPISTKGDMQISEHMPKTAQVMDNLSLVRSMSTREADHARGTYYMHSAYVPNPTVVHPTFGSVVSYELGSRRKELDIPSFISVGGSRGSAGFLGMSHSPFVVSSNGTIQNAEVDMAEQQRLGQRLDMLQVLESGFIKSKRGESANSHKDIYKKAVNLMTSKQMEAFKVDQEPAALKEAYGTGNFGQGLLLARRLVEVGVPFIEVSASVGSWDLHQGVFDSLKNQNLPQLDKGISALVTDLKQRAMLDDVTIVCMGEFGRTPRINQNVGRDHWAASWTAMVGGGGLKNGQAIGKTDSDGIGIEGKSYLPGDLWATVAHSLGIPLDIVHTSKRGRPMKLANGGTPIKELIG